MKDKVTTLKRKSKEWWIRLAVLEAAKRERNRNGFPPSQDVELNQSAVQDVIDGWKKSRLKQRWLILTHRDIVSLTLNNTVVWQ